MLLVERMVLIEPIVRPEMQFDQDFTKLQLYFINKNEKLKNLCHKVPKTKSFIYQNYIHFYAS